MGEFIPGYIVKKPKNENLKTMNIKLNESMSEQKRIDFKNTSQQISDLVEQVIETGDVIYKQHILHNIDSACQKMHKLISAELKEMPENYMIKEYEKDLIEISKTANIIHFSMQENLPHKITFNRSTRKENYWYDTQEYYTWCYDSTMKYFEQNGPLYFKEKCAVLFVSYYDENTNAIDNDNLDVKYFIDGALRPFITGDNPFALSILFEGRRGACNHTDIYFGPLHDISLLYTRLIELGYDKRAVD